MKEQSRYGGLTVNERLFLAGLMQVFDTAARCRDRTEMIRLLKKVEVDDAVWTADSILNDPER